MTNRPRSKTLYDRLGVLQTATTVQIKAAFRKLALTAHPDHGGTNDEFRLLEEARCVLTDAGRRAARVRTRARDSSSHRAPSTAASYVTGRASTEAARATWWLPGVPAGGVNSTVRLSVRRRAEVR